MVCHDFPACSKVPVMIVMGDNHSPKAMAMIRTFCVGLLLVFSYPAIAGEDCDKIGTRTFCRDGTSYETLGNRIYGSDGSRYERIGDKLYSSDGITHERLGNKIYSSGNGITHEKIGDRIYSDRDEEKSIARKVLFEEKEKEEEFKPLFPQEPLSYEPIAVERKEEKTEIRDLPSIFGHDDVVFLPE